MNTWVRYQVVEHESSAPRTSEDLVIELRVLGPISLKRSDGSNISALLSQPKRLALAAFLASPPPHGGRCLHRKDSLIAMFWPDLDQQRARAALRNSLYFLRKCLRASAVVTEADVAGLDPHEVWCDLDAFDVAVHTRDYATTYNLYRGDLLDGLCIPNADPFDEWLDAQRRRRSAEAREAVAQAARRHAAAGRADEALVWARRARQLAPLNEDSARLLIAMRYVSGDRAGALDEFQRFEALLDTEYGVPPSTDSQKLAQAIRDPDANPAAVANLIAQLPLHPTIASLATVSATHANSAVYDRQVLEAFVQTRIGLARRRGDRVSMIVVAQGDETKKGSAERGKSNAHATVMLELQQVVLNGIRAADLVASIDQHTLAILPAEDGAADVGALVGRLHRQFEVERTARNRNDSPRLVVHWLDPSTDRNASELLADVLGAR